MLDTTQDFANSADNDAGGNGILLPNLKEEVILMTGLPASLFNNLSNSAAAVFREALEQRNVLSEAGNTPSPNDNPEQITETESDEVTLRGRNNNPAALRKAGLDAAGLYALVESFGAARPGNSANSGGPSIQALFGQLTAQFSGSSFTRLLEDLDAKLLELSEGDPEQGSRLKILLSALAQLNPDGADRLLKHIHGAMNRVLDIWSNPPSANPAPNATTTTTEMVHFELDFEMEFSGEAEFILAELRDNGIDVQAARVEFSQRISVHIEFTGVRQEMRKADPLILDLNGDGVQLTGVEDGVDFDLDGDGSVDRSAFVQNDDAFLALDRNGNGRIDNGRELFGDQHGALNGFEELAKFDDNQDGFIDQNDAVYSELRLLHDRNKDGLVGLSEFSSLADQNIKSLDLGYLAGMQDDRNGNTLAEHSNFRRSDGTTGKLVDAWLRYRG